MQDKYDELCELIQDHSPEFYFLMLREAKERAK